MKQEIRKQLLSMAEHDYQKFSSGLIPGVENMLGIRLPNLRKMAKKIAKEDWRTAIEGEDGYFEERMLHGMVLSYVPEELEIMLPYIIEFIPLVNNWSVCDSIFMGMTVFQKDRERTWEFIQPYLKSEKEFEIRIALVILMQHLMKCDKNGKKISRLRKVSTEMVSNAAEEKGKYLDRVFQAVSQVNTDNYYASMMAAWLTAETFCCFPYHTMEFIKKDPLDRMTGNRAIQKIMESKIPDNEVKYILKGWKIREIT